MLVNLTLYLCCCLAYCQSLSMCSSVPSCVSVPLYLLLFIWLQQQLLDATPVPGGVKLYKVVDRESGCSAHKTGGKSIHVST